MHKIHSKITHGYFSNKTWCQQALKKVYKIQLKNKRFVITGASSGIGLEITKQLLDFEAVRVVGVARNVETLGKINNDRLFPLSADIALPENVESVLDRAIELMGGIDAIIACAGFAYYEHFENRDYGHIKSIFDTNVLSPLYTLELLLQKTKEKVSFTMLSSALGKFGLAGYSLYCSTKYALDGFADSFQFEPVSRQKSRLHYMTVYPIGVKTPFWNIHTDMPLPRPLQSANSVAKAVIRGLKKEKRKVYTSGPFHFIWALNRICPIFKSAYQNLHRRRFTRWLKRGKH